MPIGSGSPYRDSLPNAMEDLQPRFGNGQMQSSPVPPTTTGRGRMLLKIIMNEDTRDYSKPPGMKNPLPATLPKPRITAIVGGKTCEVSDRMGVAHSER